MTVVIITNNSNGLYLFRRHLISTLIEKGNEVVALTPFDIDIEHLVDLGIKLVETPIDRRGINPFIDYRLLLNYNNQLQKIKPDLVITYTIKPNVYGGLVCRRLRIPYAANITGLGSAFEGNGLLSKLVTILNRIALKKAKVVFFENDANRELFVSKKIVKKEKTHVLHGAGVDLQRFFYQDYPKDEGVTRFLFIGRIMKEKGIKELLEVMKRFQREGVPISLDVLGDFEETEFEQEFALLAKEEWFRYHGSQDDVRLFIADAHCFVLPSYHEGMANTNLENASSGRPVITSDIPGCREAVIDGETGFLCKPKDEESLYRVMKKFTKMNNEDRERMGKAGRKRMEELFDKRKVVNETISILLH